MEVLKFYLKIVWDVFKKNQNHKKNIADLLNRKSIDFSGSEEMTSLLGNLFFFNYIESTLLMCITIESKNCQR